MKTQNILVFLDKTQRKRLKLANHKGFKLSASNGGRTETTSKKLHNGHGKNNKKDLFFHKETACRLKWTAPTEGKEMNFPTQLKKSFFLYPAAVWLCIQPFTAAGAVEERKSGGALSRFAFWKNDSSDSRRFAPRNMILYAGPSIYSAAGGRKSYKSRAFQSFSVGFSQTLKSAPYVGGLLLKTEIQHLQLKSERATQLNITPAFRLPEAESGFPVYVGFGPGLGFYPFRLIQGEAWLSLNTMFLLGLTLPDIYENIGLNGEISLNIHCPLKEKKLYMETLFTMGLVFSF